MTPKELLKLGFEEVKVTAKESGGSAYTYYTFDPYLGDDTASLISDEIDEGDDVDKDLTVEFFNTRDNQAPLSDKFIRMFTKEFRK